MPSRHSDRRPVAVLIADDHPVIRDGLRTALSGQPDLRVVGEARDGLEAEERAVQLSPDVIVMDLSMPRRTGLEAMVSIKRKLPEVKVLFLTVSERDEDLFQAIRLGADGYLLKESDVGDIVEAVRSIARGEASMSPRMTARLMKEMGAGQGKAVLSAREQQVLDLLSGGLSNSEIAERLFVSQATVATYVYRLLEKLHLRNRAEAIAYSARRSTRDDPR